MSECLKKVNESENYRLEAIHEQNGGESTQGRGRTHRMKPLPTSWHASISGPNQSGANSIHTLTAKDPHCCARSFPSMCTCQEQLSKFNIWPCWGAMVSSTAMMTMLCVKQQLFSANGWCTGDKRAWQHLPSGQKVFLLACLPCAQAKTPIKHFLVEQWPLANFYMQESQGTQGWHQNGNW